MLEFFIDHLGVLLSSDDDWKEILAMVENVGEDEGLDGDEKHRLVVDEINETFDIKYPFVADLLVELAYVKSFMDDTI